MPVLGRREVDLFELYDRVKSRGGIRDVVLNRRWPEIVKLMPLPKTCTNAGFSLKLLYQKYLLDYERVFEWGQPDVKPPGAPRGGMPIPDYPPENVALPDPYMGKGRPDYGEEAAPVAMATGGSRKRLRGDGGDGDEGTLATSGSATQLVAEEAAEDEEEQGEEGELPEAGRRELGAALKRVQMALASRSAREVDWALSVLVVQTRKKLPVFARDPTHRVVEELATLLRDAEAHPLDALMGHLLNPLAFEGAQRRARIAVVLVNAVGVEENLKAACAGGGATLLSALVADLGRVPPGEERDLETRRNLFVVLEALVARGARVGGEQAEALLQLLVGEMECRDLRQPVCLAALGKLARGGEQAALLSPAAARALVRLLGEAMARQAAPGAGEAGLLELEGALEALVGFSAEPAAAAALLGAQAPHLLVALLRGGGPSAPRHLVTLARRAVVALTHLCSATPAVADLLRSSYLSDLLLVATGAGPVALEVAPLLMQLGSS
jgi:hypothetical protein